MPRVIFAAAVQRHVPAPPVTVDGACVRDALEAAFVHTPRLRGYVLDDQAHLRKHMSVYVDGVAIRDRTELSETVASNSEIYVLQALSGG